MFDTRELNIVIELWCTAFSLVCIITALFVTRTERQYRSHFVKMFSMALLTSAGDALAGIYRGAPGQTAWLATHAGNFLTYTGGFLLAITVTAYLCARITEADGPLYEAWRSAVFLLAAAMIICNVVGIFYSIDENNLYHRSQWHWIAQAYLIGVNVGNATLVLRNAKRFTKPTLLCMQFYTLVPLVAVTVQTFVYGPNFSIIGSTIGAIVLFVEMQAHSSKMLVERTEELAQSRVQLSESRVTALVMQLQPNMMFETLDVIADLCDEDPASAKRALSTFSAYQKKNLDAMCLTTPIPIKTEIDQVRTYLQLVELERRTWLQHQVTMLARTFVVPPRSVQTIVENSVYWALATRMTHCQITVSTGEAQYEYWVSIVSEGTSGNDATSTIGENALIGIEDVRTHLAAMCNGTLDITVRPSQGITAVMHLPKQLA